jgi:protein-S-isoprenylcysteine O-methyltransferase Ste14
VRRDQYVKSTLYVGFGIGTLVILFPWLIRYEHIQVLPFLPGPLHWAGVAVLLLGAAMYFSCAWDFNARGQGTPAFWDPPRRLILNPWFRWVRNPMYVGVFLMNVGQGLWFGSTVTIIYAFLVTLGFHVFVVGYEEPHLERVYGQRYREYRRRVPRWIPRPPHRTGEGDYGAPS